jgi:hypothetical protein
VHIPAILFIIDLPVVEVVEVWNAVDSFLEGWGLTRNSKGKIVHALPHKGCCWSRYDQLIEDIKTMLNGF